MLLLFVSAVSHLPTYNGCINNCCKPPHHHDQSQVVYLKGSGGLEIHLESETDPIDSTGHEIMDVDIVFRDRPDLSTFSVYIGCGGCAETDTIVTDPVEIVYQTGKLEPFTQTRYYSGLPDETLEVPLGRTFNSSALSAEACPSRHFGIRLVDHKNRSDGSTIVWAPVIGLSEVETMSPFSLLRFPIFLLSNHGDAWNEQGWTVFVVALTVVPMAFMLVLWLSPKPDPVKKPLFLFYAFAFAVFVACAVEELVHIIYAQRDIPVESGFWIGLSVILLSQIVPALYSLSLLRTTLLGDKGNCMCWFDRRWIYFNILLAAVHFFWFGSGFFLGPSTLTIAGITYLCRGTHGIYASANETSTQPSLLPVLEFQNVGLGP